MAKASTVKEEQPTLLISIEAALLQQLYATQISEYQDLKQKVAEHCTLSADTLEHKGLFRHLSYNQYRFG
jgi:hypothetical protein